MPGRYLIIIFILCMVAGCKEFHSANSAQDTNQCRLIIKAELEKQRYKDNEEIPLKVAFTNLSDEIAVIFPERIIIKFTNEKGFTRVWFKNPVSRYISYTDPSSVTPRKAFLDITAAKELLPGHSLCEIIDLRVISPKRGTYTIRATHDNTLLHYKLSNDEWKRRENGEITGGDKSDTLISNLVEFYFDESTDSKPADGK